MKITEQFIETVQRRLPELATAKDLVRCGMYRSPQAAYAARRTGKCPPYLRIPQRGIVYPKNGVLQFLKGTCHEPDQKLEPEKKSGFVIGNGSISHRNGYTSAQK